jgi:shikimate 5-dehydrogenase
MSKLDRVQEYLTNDLTIFRETFFDNMEEIQVISFAKGSTRKAPLYRVPTLEYFESWHVSGIVGGRRPSTYSESPWLWNTYFKNLGVKGVFFCFDLPIEKDFNEFFQAAFDVAGLLDLTITDPYKSVAVKALEQTELPVTWSEQAKHTHAVNHILVDSSGPELIALNTDGVGMFWAVKDRSGISGKKVLIIGAGGSAVSIGYEFAKAGCNTCIINRTPSKAKDASALLARFTGPSSEIQWGGFDSLSSFLKEADIVISTVVEGCPIHPGNMGLLKEGVILAETKYGAKADLKQAAQEKGLAYIDGRAMLFGQFVEAAVVMGPLVGIAGDRHKKLIDEMKGLYYDRHDNE